MAPNPTRKSFFHANARSAIYACKVMQCKRKVIGNHHALACVQCSFVSRLLTVRQTLGRSDHLILIWSDHLILIFSVPVRACLPTTNGRRQRTTSEWMCDYCFVLVKIFQKHDGSNWFWWCFVTIYQEITLLAHKPPTAEMIWTTHITSRQWVFVVLRVATRVMLQQAVHSALAASLSMTGGAICNYTCFIEINPL